MEDIAFLESKSPAFIIVVLKLIAKFLAVLSKVSSISFNLPAADRK